MLRKNRGDNSGFTIIEVVITIAIGAAVMALVLNAVAGARRSQRNNARQADVNQVAAAINQYIATRNSLPTNWAAIDSIHDDAWGHYTDGQVNEALSWDNTTHPVAGQTFAWNAAYAAAPAAAGAMGTAGGAVADNIVVVNEAACNAANILPVAAGIREVVIVYRLEGQADTLCLEV